MKKNVEAKKSLYEGFAYYTRQISRFFGPFPVDFIHTKNSPLGPYSKIGEQMAKDLASCVEKELGDGSIRALLICEAFIRIMLYAMDNGEDLFSLCKEAKDGLKVLERTLQENGYLCAHLFDAALTAAKGDEEIAFLISDSLERGNLLILEGEEDHEELHGILIEDGYTNPHFVAHRGRSYFDSEDVEIFLCKKPIASPQLALTLLSEIKQTPGSALVIGESFSKDAVASLLLNHLRGFADLCVVESSFAKNLVSYDGEDASLENCAVMGRADRVIVTDQATLIASSELEHDRITILYTNHEMIPLFNKVKKSTLLSKDGVVFGGGFAYFSAAKALQKLQEKGAHILAQSILAPSTQLIKNAALDPSIVLEEIAQSPSGYGYNLFTQKIEHLGQAGVLDPLFLTQEIVTMAIEKAEEILSTDLLVPENRS